MIRRLALCLLLLLAAHPAQAGQKRIALTFDDVPRVPGGLMTPSERTVALIAALKRAGVRQAAFFVNPSSLAQPWGKGGEDRIMAYVAAGHVIGNHSWSHPHLTGMDTDAYMGDVDKAADWLKGREGFRPLYRFPFLDEGADAAQRDAVRAALEARGLHNAYVTVEPADWHLEGLLTDAAKAGKTIDMAALRDLYVRDVVGAADHSEHIARDILGRSVIHVVLMHETDLEALFVEDVVKALKADGWEIATVDEAYRHPLPDPTGVHIGGNQLVALAVEKGRSEGELSYPPSEPETLTRLFNERVLKTPHHPDESQDP